MIGVISLSRDYHCKTPDTPGYDCYSVCNTTNLLTGDSELIYIFLGYFLFLDF